MNLVRKREQKTGLSQITTAVVCMSRKQVMNEFEGLKRSYYMDPQTLNRFKWHYYEYEINKCDACALYRLESKLVDGKKSAKGISANDTDTDGKTHGGVPMQ
ncbi:hypothetical protein ERO13_D06G209350v2 [Gossypium hirsutum]|nr:hypothetical protein ERO13_D06G209350v2 [Gossypium hirsutum]TYG66304.1 hypothetical protein ES288_D06G257300v1 [Gossypium darwinii]TYH68465.1 hypothetical protein ES332_D06G261700v1 [Gossypium tomentosum]